MSEFELLQDGIWRVRQYVRTRDHTVTGYTPQELKRYLIVREYDHLPLVLFNYSEAASYHADWNSFLRVCRGIVLDREGQLVSFPLQKFFNLNERIGWRDPDVSSWQVASVMDKVDGVMIQVFPYAGGYVWASRHGVETRAAQIARALAGDAIASLVSSLPHSQWTLVMELVHPDVWQPGMVHSGEERALYLLYVRWLHSMELVPAHQLWQEVPSPFRLPRRYSLQHLRDILELVHSAQTPDWEGVVVQGAEERGNLLVKLKSSLYLQRLVVVKGLSFKGLLRCYEQEGWKGVELCFLGAEELMTSPPYDRFLESIRQQEQLVRAQAEHYLQVPCERVEEVPVEWRWCIGYRHRPGRLESAIRKMAVQRVKSVMERQEREEDEFGTQWQGE